MVYANGDIYEGYFREGLASGQGILTETEGGQYDGDWENNKRNGHGTET